jgi:signal peptidase I
MNEPNDTAKPAAPARKRPTPDSSIKETIESIIVAFILAFVFRAFVVEAFVIPTGSMAPTLLGDHISFTCPQCGYGFHTDTRDSRIAGSRKFSTLLQGNNGYGINGNQALRAPCPMCQFDVTEPQLRTKAGDRILVLKYVYALSEPRRWDVVVFRNPSKPAENYIKRLVGLPNEWLSINRGNIYTSTDEGGTWQVRTKPEHAQRAMWQPIYHSRYVPLDAQSRPWQSPWRTSGRWRSHDQGLRFSYTHSETSADPPGALNFEFGLFDARRAIEGLPSSRDFCAYNIYQPGMGLKTLTFAQDLRLAATITSKQTDIAAGQRPALVARLRLQTDAIEVRGVVDANGERRIEARPTQINNAKWTTLGQPVAGRPFVPDQATRVELWHVDHDISLWVDGRQVVLYRLPLSITYDPRDPTGPRMGIHPKIFEGAAPEDELAEALALVRLPDEPAQVSLSLEGASADVKDVDLDRDVFYTDRNRNHRPESVTGVMANIAKIGPDQFFCLGDNSPASHDSRLWNTVNDWVKYHTADPAGPHGPQGVPPGYVPRKLLIGRAFFVYFPAPFGLSRTSFPFIPNFGDLRFIR